MEENCLCMVVADDDRVLCVQNEKSSPMMTVYYVYKMRSVAKRYKRTWSPMNVDGIQVQSI